MSEQSPVPKVLLFDVNGTLLDLAPLKRRIDDILIDPAKAELWFATMLQHSLAMTVAGLYAPFPDIGAVVLRMLAQNSDLAMSEADAKEVLWRRPFGYRDIHVFMDRQGYAPAPIRSRNRL